jgi:K+-transporting ATPase, c chain
LVGNIPGLNITTKSNPYATPTDPTCVPVQATDKDGNDITDKAGNPVYEKNKDGTYVCDPNTVPQRLLAYLTFNGVPAGVKVPVDAVTASDSGLDPDISPANAYLQAPRVAKVRDLPLATVNNLIKQHTDDPEFGVLGEKTVNVLDLNLALAKLKP